MCKLVDAYVSSAARQSRALAVFQGWLFLPWEPTCTQLVLPKISAKHYTLQHDMKTYPE